MIDEYLSESPQAFATSFVGRELELAQLEALLVAENARLITIVGIGGSGKTRLAQELIARARPRFRDGARFVQLQGFSDPAALPAAIVESVEPRLAATHDAGDSLLAALADREILLVLDNFEQLKAGADLCRTILDAAPATRLVLTSREPLGLAGEIRFTLHGLAVPEDQGVEQIERSAAARLFAERAALVWPAFRLDAEREAVVRICRLTAGLPLALELAASWTHTLSCAAIAERIEQSIDLLIPARNRQEPLEGGMRAVLDQLWEQLTGDERAVFARLSLFRGGFTHRAAAHVAGARPETLAALVERAVIVRNGEQRYGLHELLRQYAEQRLEAVPGDGTAARERFVGYFTDMLAMLAPELYGPGQRRAADVIAADADNVRQAWRWAVAGPHLGSLLRSGYVMWAYHHQFASAGDGIDLFAEALARLRGLPPDPIVERALAFTTLYLGWLTLRRGEVAQALVLFEESSARYQALAIVPPPGFTTDPVLGLAMVALWQSRSGDAQQHAEAALRRAEATGHRLGCATARYQLASAKRLQGRYGEARRLAQQAASAAADLGHIWLHAYCLDELGTIARATQDYAEAKRCFQASHSAREAIGDTQGRAIAAALLGSVAALEGRLDEAAHHYDQSVATLRSFGNRDMIVRPLLGLAQIRAEQGAYEGARLALLEGLGHAASVGFGASLPEALLVAARLLAATGRPEQAAECLAFLLARGASDDDLLTRARRDLDALSAVLTPEAFGAATERGQDSVLERAIVSVQAALATPLENRRLAGAVWTEPDPTQMPAAGPGITLPREQLTPREREVLALLSAGLTNKAIAERLVTSVHTVNSHVKAIFAKLGVTTRAAAVSAALTGGLVPPIAAE